MSRVGTKSGWSGNCVENISTSKTLSGTDSGKIFMCTHGSAGDTNAGAVTITLPTPSVESAGFNAKFILPEDNAGNSGDETIEIACSTVTGVLTDDGDTTTSDGVKIVFDQASAKGDMVEVICDGTQYWAYGRESGAAKLSIA